MNDFNDDFDNFEDDGFNDFNQNRSLSDIWRESPILKIFVIVAAVILVIAAVIIFGGSKEEQESRTTRGVDQKEVLGQEVSQQYQNVIDEVNEQRLEEAVQTGSSTIPMLTSADEPELFSEDNTLPPYEEFDPLATFRSAVSPEVEEQPAEEPRLVEPQEVFNPQPQQAPAPSPETVQALAQAMSASVQDIFGQHAPTMPEIMYVTAEDYYEQQAETSGDDDLLVENSADSEIDSIINGGTSGEETVQTILVPAGTINYAQTLIEANSDVPGPVLAQLMSGPLKGARLIGEFSVEDEVLVLTFSSVVVDGINQPVSAIALNPTTTLGGVATEVNHRYWQRVILPAAARFLEGIGSAIAEDTQTTVTVSGDTVIEEQNALDFEQELGRGVEEGLGEIADFMDDESDDIQPLIRVARGTPIGVFFMEPVIENNVAGQ